jgi:hypothetical protein
MAPLQSLLMKHITYKAMFLRSIYDSVLHHSKLRVDHHIWQRLKVIGLTDKCSRRGCRAGRALRKAIPVICGNRNILVSTTRKSNVFQVRPNLLFIQTFNASPNSITHCYSEYLNTPTNGQVQSNQTDTVCSNLASHRNSVPVFMLSNVMSLVPKLPEVNEFIIRENVDFGVITETWLRGSIPDSVVSMDHLHYRLNFDLDKNFITA